MIFFLAIQQCKSAIGIYVSPPSFFIVTVKINYFILIGRLLLYIIVMDYFTLL